MRNLSQLMAFLLISLIASPIFAAKGCDSLKSYVYNASDKTLKVKFDEPGTYNPTIVAVVKPGEVALIGISEDDSLPGKHFVSSHLQVYADDNLIVDRVAMKYYSQPPGVPTTLPIVNAPSPSSGGGTLEPISLFAINNEVQPGECATWQPGVWILTIQSKAKTPPLP